MTDVKGRSGVLQVSVAGSSYTAVGGVKDVSMSFSGATIEVTDFDSAGWQQFLSGNRTMTLSATMNYDEADAGQDIIWTSNHASTTIYYRWRPGGSTSTLMQWVSQGIITSLEETQAQDGAAELSMDIQLTGTPTMSAQS